nr:hypothetical protein [Corynebacterium sp. UBA5992]
MAIVAAVIAALNTPVDKGFKELEDEDNIEKTAEYREIHTVFEPVWGTRWFHYIFTFPRVECDGFISNCKWGRNKALVRNGGVPTVGFSYRFFDDRKLRCKSSPVEISSTSTGLEAKTSIINNSPMHIILH